MAVALALLAAGVGFSASYLGLCEEAVKRLKEGKPLWALSFLSMARERNPTHPLSWSLSGAAWALAGRWEEAARHVARAKKLSPSDPLARFVEGLLRLRAGEVEAAARALRVLLEGKKLGSRPLAFLALVLLLSGNVEGARRAAEEATSGEGKPLAEAVLAWVLARSGDWEGAVRKAQEALKAKRRPREGVLKLVLDTTPSGEPAPGWDMERGRKEVAFLAEPAPLPPPKRLDLPEGLRIAPVQPDGSLKGEVTISGVPPGVADASFVCIKIDGETVYLSNTPPFEFVWDTRLSEDGLHKVSFISLGKDGSVVGEASAEVVVRNRPEPPPDPAKVAELEGVAIRLLASKVKVDCEGALRKLIVLGLSKIGHKAKGSGGRKESRAKGPSPVSRSRGEEGVENRPRPPLPPAKPPRKPRVVLIFDDGPHPKATLAILDILDKFQIRATFFLTGSAVRRYPELAREIVRRGHEVGGHGYTGRRLHILPDWEVEAEVRSTIKAIREVCGVEIRLFRPPGERMSGVVRKVLKAHNLEVVGHDIEDWPYRLLPPEEAARRILGRVSEGKIILLHNGPHVPVALIEGVVRGLVQMGYKPVGVTEFRQGRP